jgi:hypothetical protein
MILRWLVACGAACVAMPAAALLMRADRDEAEYLEMATRYASSVLVGEHAGEGVLIAPRWVLTAAANVRGASPASRLRVVAAGRPQEVEASFVHPESTIALLLLAAAVPDVEGTPIHRGADESGKAVVIVGRGSHGRIGGATMPGDGRARAGVNTVDRADAKTLGLRVKPPDEASDLQGTGAADERGAPAYLDARDGISVAGIRSGTEGAWETFWRVSAFASWIDDTIWAAARDRAGAVPAKPRQ